MIKVRNEFYSFVALLYVFLSLLGYQLVTSLLLPMSSDIEGLSSTVTYPYRVVVFLLAAILIVTSPKMKQKGPGSGMVTFYVIFMLYYFLRIIIDIYVRRVFVLPSWRSTTLQYMLIVVLPSIFAMIRCVSYIDLEKLGRWLMWGALSFLVLLFINQNTLIRFEYDEMTRGESNVAMGSLNLGYSCVLIFSVLLSRLSEKHYKWFWNIALVFFMVISFVVMLRAASRGPLVCWSFLILFFFFSKVRNKALAIAVSLVFLLLAWVNLTDILDWLGNISPLMEQRMMDTLSEGSFSGRDNLYSEAIETFLQYPVLGKQFVLSNGFYAHNSMLDVMIGLGMFGALAWTFIIIKDVVFSSHSIASNSSSLLIGLLSIVYLIEGMFSGAMYISAKVVICLIIVFNYNSKAYNSLNWQSHSY